MTTAPRTCCKPGFSQVLCRRGNTDCETTPHIASPRLDSQSSCWQLLKMFWFTLSAIKYETRIRDKKIYSIWKYFWFVSTFRLKDEMRTFLLIAWWRDVWYWVLLQLPFGISETRADMKTQLRKTQCPLSSINTDHKLFHTHTHTQIISAWMSVPLTVCVYVCDFNSLSLPSDTLEEMAHPKMWFCHHVVLDHLRFFKPRLLSFFCETQNDSFWGVYSIDF